MPGRFSGKARAVLLLTAKLVVLILLVAPALSAHAIERASSFSKLERDAVAVLAVEVVESNELRQGARLEVLDVFRAPADAGLEKGCVVATGDGADLPSAASYKKGVCFAFLVKDATGRWVSLFGPHTGYARPRADYAKDGRLDFLGSLVSREQVLAAMHAQPELSPGAANRLLSTDMRRWLTHAAAWPPAPLLGDERMGVYRRWVTSGNPLLALSALVDANDLAIESAGQMPGSPRRTMPQTLLGDLAKLALGSLNSPNPWEQSAALAILECTGMPPEALEVLRRVCRSDGFDPLAIVRKEAFRFIGTAPGANADDIALLLDGLLDPALKDEMFDYPAEGLRMAVKANAALAQPALQRASAWLISGKAWERALGVRAVGAVGLADGYSKLHVAWAAEQNPELKYVMLKTLGAWADERNLDVLGELLARNRDRMYYDVFALEAMRTLSTLRSDSATAVLRAELEARNTGPKKHMHDSPDLLAALATGGDGQALLRLLELAQPGFEAESWRSAVVRALHAVPDDAVFDTGVFEAVFARVRASPDADLRAGLLDGWLSRFFVGGRVLRPAPREMLVPGEPLPLEACALAWLGAKDKREWETAIVRFLRAESSALRERACKLCGEFVLATALEPLVNMPAETPALAFARAVAVKRLDGAKGGDLLRQFFREMDLTPLLQSVGFGFAGQVDYFSEPECRFALSRLADRLLSGAPADLAAASAASMLLNRLTGHYDGYTASLALDPRANRAMGLRWRTWLAKHVDSLAWDATARRFARGG